jgi:hypothetical protein
VNAYLNENGGDHSVERRREIRLALQMNECQFDYDSVTAYLQEERRSKANLLSADEENF